MKKWMSKNRKVLGLFGIAFVMFVFWLFPYLGHNEVLSSKLIRPFEITGIILIGLGAGLSLSLKKDSYWFTILLVFTPFVFARPFSAKTIPWELIVAGALAVIGAIISLIRFKYKLKKGPFFIGLAIFAISCILGGALNFNELYLLQYVVISLIVTALLVLFVYLHSINSITFLDFSWIMFALGLYISMQCAAYLFTNHNFTEILSKKDLNVGWGISNNIATIMILLVPFTAYLIFHYQKWKTLFFAISVIPQSIAVIFTYSRGGLFAYILMLIAVFIYGFFVVKEKFTYFLLAMGAILSIFLILLVGMVFKPEVMNRFFDIMSINKLDMAPRIEIYKTYLSNLKPNFIFGKGLFEPFISHFDIDVPESGNYLWGHGTWIHCLYTTGIVGVGAWLFHTVQKYVYLLKEHSKESMIVFFAFIFSGLYGMIDVSFYFINYMILFIVILTMFKNKLVEGE